MQDVYIVSVARTPIGSFNGALSSLSAVELGSIAIKAAVERAGIDTKIIEEVFMGNVLSANLGQAPAKQAALGAGVTHTTPCTTVNKVCASGMKAIMLGAQSIRLGENDVVVAGGMESMSNAPYYVAQGRRGYRLGHGELSDAILRDALLDPFKGHHMGNAAEICASGCNIPRDKQDEFAIESYTRSAKAYENNAFKDELVPVPVPQRKGEPVMVSVDEEFKNVDFGKLKSLRPVFQKEGTVTAANASKINDGAAAVVLMSKRKADELGIKPLAKVVSYADASQEPDWFTTTPSKAMPKAVERAGLSMNDIEYFEINEAFSVVALANIDEMKLNPERVNVYGGAVSLGHPVGVSGARIVITLLSALKNNNARLGCAGICNGGGGASAIVIERV